MTKKLLTRNNSGYKEIKLLSYILGLELKSSILVIY